VATITPSSLLLHSFQKNALPDANPDYSLLTVLEGWAIRSEDK